MLALTFEHQGRVEEAIRQFRLVVSVDPLDVGAYNAMAKMLSTLDEVEEASQMRQVALDHHSAANGGLEPLPSVVSLGRIGVLQVRSGLWPIAADTLRRAIASGSNRLDLYLLAARSTFLMRSFADSQRIIDGIRLVSPDCLEANVIGAALAFRSGRRQDADDLMERAYSCDPSGRVMDKLLVASSLPLVSIRRAVILEPVSTPDQYASADSLSRRVTVEEQAESVPAVERLHERADEQVPWKEESAPVVAVTSDFVAPDDFSEFELTQFSTGNEPDPLALSLEGEESPESEPPALSPEVEEPVEPEPVVVQTTSTSWEAEAETQAWPTELARAMRSSDVKFGESGPPSAEDTAGAEDAPPELVLEQDGGEESDADEETITVSSFGQQEEDALFGRAESHPIDTPEEPVSGEVGFYSASSEYPTEGGSASEVQQKETVDSSLQKGESESIAPAVFSPVPAPAESTDEPFPDFEAWFKSNVLDAVGEDLKPSFPAHDEARSEPAHARDSQETSPEVESDAQLEPSVLEASADSAAPTTEGFPEVPAPSPTPNESQVHAQPQPTLPSIADLTAVVDEQPLNNGARFELARALEATDVTAAVSQYAEIVDSRDPRLMPAISGRLVGLLDSGVKIHGLKRLLGDVSMQQGAFEQAIDFYSQAFDELRSRQITGRGL